MKKFVLAILCILLCIGVFLSVSAKADSNNSNIDVSIDITYHEVGDDIYMSWE